MEIYIKDFNKEECLGGIYAIVSRRSKKIYIGETQNLKTRYSNHLSQLRYNRHPSKRLQEEFNKFGKENFSYVVLMKCPEFLRRANEDAFLRRIPDSESLNGSDRFRGDNEHFIKIYKDKEIGSIHRGHRAILQGYKEWYEDGKYNHMDCNEFLMELVLEGIKLYNVNYEGVFKYIYDAYADKTKYMDNFLDYAALPILKELLNWKNDKNIYNLNAKFSSQYSFRDNTLIHRILNSIKEDKKTLDDLITANSTYYFNLLEIDNQQSKYLNDKFDFYRVELLFKSSINNVFDFLYYYIFTINSSSYLEDVNLCTNKSYVDLKLDWEKKKTIL